MRIFTLFLLLLIMASLSMACSSTENHLTNNAENNAANSNGNGIFVIQVDKSKVIITDEVELPEYFPPVPPNSYAITQTQTYESWTRTYAGYYPCFTDEITYAGSEPIKQYYAELAKSEKEHGYWEMGDTVLSTYLDRHLYICKTYETGFFDQYLSVLFFSTWYGGGAHSLEHYTVDNFDMTTGKLLTIEDLFGEEQTYRPILNRVICKQLLSQKRNHVRLDEDTDIINYTNNLQFRICDTGIEFIFQIYEIGSYSDGAFFIKVPYQDLEPILVINIGNK